MEVVTATKASDVAEAAPAVVVADLNFTYGVAAGHKPILHGINMQLPRGSRTLLVGDNGAGKSTLLRILAGRHLHKDGCVTVLGRSSFHDTSLNLRRAYLGTDWGRKVVAFAGVSVMTADVPVREMMAVSTCVCLDLRI